jgi:hypothetical protein
MSIPRRRVLATVLTAAAVSLPATAEAKIDLAPVRNLPSHSLVIAAPAASDSGFQWGDAGLGAGGALVLVSAAGATLVLARRVRHTSGSDRAPARQRSAA